MGVFRNLFASGQGTASERGQYELVDNMAERESNLAQFHATEVELRTSLAGRPVQDMAGGEEPRDIMTKSEAAYDATSMSSAGANEPTDEEKRTLRKVADKLPWATFLVAVVELCERFTYYGLSGPFQNYISNSYHDPNGLPGAIGLNQSGATGLTNFFQFWCYVTPVLGAIIADQYLGKYWTIFWSAVIYTFGVLILFLTSLPVSIENGAALGGLVAAMIVIGLGTGGIKSNVSPMIAEQYRSTKPFIRTLKSGERVIVDPAVTIQRIYMIFYLVRVGYTKRLVGHRKRVAHDDVLVSPVTLVILH